MLSLLELRAEHPTLFAPQTWYDEEPFAKRQDGIALLGLPTQVVPCVNPLPHWRPLAVEVANLFVLYPDESVWDGFLWTADRDRWGQRVFVGGRQMKRGFAGDGRFQVHRWVTPTIGWGDAVWD